MWHTDLLLAFLCSHAISPTIAWCKKSGTWDCIKSSYHLGAFYWQSQMEMHSLSLLCWPTLSLCLLFLRFLATGPVLAAAVPRLAARPWRPLTNKVKKGGFEFLKGRGRWRVCAFVCLWGALRVTEDSFAVCHHFQMLTLFFWKHLSSQRPQPETWPPCCAVL